jgi:hypothetical protein
VHGPTITDQRTLLRVIGAVTTSIKSFATQILLLNNSVGTNDSQQTTSTASLRPSQPLPNDSVTMGPRSPKNRHANRHKHAKGRGGGIDNTDSPIRTAIEAQLEPMNLDVALESADDMLLEDNNPDAKRKLDHSTDEQPNEPKVDDQEAAIATQFGPVPSPRQEVEEGQPTLSQPEVDTGFQRNFVCDDDDNSVDSQPEDDDTVSSLSTVLPARPITTYYDVRLHVEKKPKSVSKPLR